VPVAERSECHSGKYWSLVVVQVARVAYSTEIAALLAGQLARFVTLNRHQLAGQVVNLDFWLAETRHCLAAIDGYQSRFERLKAADARHVVEFGTVAFELDETRYFDEGVRPSTPKRIPDGELKNARRALCDNAYRFLVRCCREKLIDPATLRLHCDGLGIGVDPADLQRGAATEKRDG